MIMTKEELESKSDFELSAMMLVIVNKKPLIKAANLKPLML
jgi:hypothetical protein